MTSITIKKCPYFYYWYFDASGGYCKLDKNNTYPGSNSCIYVGNVRKCPRNPNVKKFNKKLQK